MVSEGVSVCDALIETLIEAPVERRQIVLNALAALKGEADITSHLGRALRSIKDPEKKKLLQRALDLSPTSFHVSDGVPSAPQLPSREEADEESVPQEDRSWWQKLLDRDDT